MNKFVKFGARVASPKLFQFVIMSKSNEKVYYAVGRGREVGIYSTWKDCKARTEGVSNAKYRKFFSLEEAEEFVNFWKNYSSPVKESSESQDSNLTRNSPSESKSIGSQLAISDDGSSFIKKEVHDVDLDRLEEIVKQCENPQSQPETFQNGDKLTSVKMLESVLTEIIQQSSDESQRLKTYFKTLMQKININSNNDVTPQAGSAENVSETFQDSNMSAGADAVGEKLRLALDEAPSSSLQQSAAPHVPHVSLQPPSPHSTSLEGSTVAKNADVLALNLRLDSFEKRFDACLKEVGAIVSELSHIKAEVKEMKETLSSKLSSDLASGSGYSPRKAKDGLLQTTLAFGSSATTPSNSFSTHQSATCSGEKPRRGKTLKRKLSRSNSIDNSKRFANGESDDDDDYFVSRINTDAVAYTSFTVDEHDYVEVYTDGASQCNGKQNAKAGIGVWWGDGHPLNLGEPVVGRPTNNTAEIQAARVAMQLAAKCGLRRLKILTDSEFLINCATRWIHRWKKNGWYVVNGGPVKNRKELEKLDRAAAKISVRWEKVAAHAGIKGNEMADRLANEGAFKYNG